MSPPVEEVAVAERPTLVVAAETTWSQFPALWPVLLDEVWACLRSNGITRGCPNVMLYRDGVPNVEVGVLLAETFQVTDRVTRSHLPAGRAAATVHRGPYAELGRTHQAVHDWSAASGRRLAGPRWEVYGPHRGDPAELVTEMFWLLD